VGEVVIVKALPASKEKVNLIAPEYARCMETI
jgi:hypothetical protein